MRHDFDHEAIILHELVHGLGFGIWNFQNSYMADGTQKQIVELLSCMVCSCSSGLASLCTVHAYGYCTL